MQCPCHDFDDPQNDLNTTNSTFNIDFDSPSTQLNSTQLNSTSIQFNSFRWFILCCSLPFSVGSLQSLPCCPYDFPLSFSDLPNHWFPFPLHCQLIACDLLLPIPFAHFYCLSVCTFITRSFLNFTNKYKLKLSFHSFQKKRRNHLSIGKRLSFRRFYF